jgi:hypothetical protein
MKSQPAVTSAFFPAALAAAAISLAILLVPGGGGPVGSSGLAPALKLVAGDVVTALKAPVLAPSQAKARTVVRHAKRAASTPERKQGVAVTPSAHAAVAPAHRAVHHSTVRRSTVHHSPAQHKHAAGHVQRTTQTAAPPAPTPVRHGNGKGIGRGNGKGKALGRLGKTARSPASASHGKGHAYANGHSATVHGHSANTRHGPPAVPPGLAYGKGGSKQGLPHGRGGGK